MSKEVWKDIVGYVGHYQVSSFGNVRSVDRTASGVTRKGRKIKLTPQKNGYLQCTFSKHNKQEQVKIHRLVAKAFLEQPNETVNHKNFDREDNRVENLEWCTQSQNIQHAHNNGRMYNNNGEKSGMSKFTNVEAREIRNSNQKSRKLAEKYKVTKETINNIKSLRTYKYV